MAADGSIRIVTKIDINDAKLKLKQLQAELKRADKAVETAQKNLAKNAPKMAAYQSEKAGISESTNLELMRAETEEQVNNVLAIEQAQLEALDQKYASVLDTQRQQEAALEEAKRTQAQLNEEVREQVGVVQNLTATQERQTQETKEAAQAEREKAKAIKETERASKQFETSAHRVGRKILTWGTAMLAVRGVIGILRKSVQAFLSDNENVANQLSAIWSAIGNALGPIIMRIIGLIQTLFAAISAFVKALTGIDLVANYNAKALQNQANATAGAGAAAEKAEKQLAGFDEMNKLTDTSSGGGGGGGGGGIEMPSLLDDIDNWLTDFATRLGMTVKDVFFDWGTTMTEEDIAQKIIVLLSAIGGGAIGFAIGGIPGALIGMTIGAGIGLIISALNFDHDGKLSEDEIANMITGALGGLVGGAIGFFVGGPMGALIGATIGLGVTLLLTGIQVTDESGQSEGLLYHIMHDVLGLPSDQEIIGSLSGISDGFWELWLEIDSWFLELDNTVYEALQKIKDAVVEWIEENWEKLCEFVENTKKKIAEMVSNGIAKFEEFKQKVKSKFEEIKQNISRIFENVKTTITTAVENAKQKFDDLKEKVLSVWDIVKSKFTSLGSVIGSAISGAIKTAINNVLSLVQSKINSAIGLINGAIGLINKLPGVSVGYLSYVSLPRLARGGVVNNPGRGVPAVIGEAGAEAVLPLERNTGWMDTLADKIASKSGANGSVVVPVYLNGRKIAEYIVDLTKRQAFATNNA